MERRRVFATHHPNQPVTKCGSQHGDCKNLAFRCESCRSLRNHHGACLLNTHRSDSSRHQMRLSSKTYRAFGCAVFCVLAGHDRLGAQQVSTADNASQQTCAGLLADNPGVSAIQPTSPGDTARSRLDTATRNRSDTASFGIGAARNGPADIILWVGVHADEVRFAKQPNVRVRLCWGGDTLRVVQRTNIPSPVVAGTTYRNVYVAVELIGRLNAECLADRLGVRTASAAGPPQRATSSNTAPTSVGACAFLGGAAGAGAQTPRPPTR
jgi:hypothetical protein